MHLLPLNDASAAYHNLKLDEKSSYLTTFAYQFGMYRYAKLPFSTALAGNKFQHKIDEIFRELTNVFGIADDILIEGYDADHKYNDRILMWVM